jgi:hypothetical protein
MSEAKIGVPSTFHLQLDERSSVPSVWRNEAALTIIRLESCTGLQGRIRKVSAIPALLVSVSIKAQAADRNCVRPLNVVRSLTAIWQSRT